MININKIAGSLAFIAAAALSSTASASIYNVSSPVDQIPYTNSARVDSVGSFSDTYNFTISSLSDWTASVTNIQLSSFLNIADLNMRIFDSANNQLSNSGSNVAVFGDNILAGSYYAIVTGTTTGSIGGAYMMSISTPPLPVPLPAAVWLLGSGLIGLVGVARRKERSQTMNMPLEVSTS